MPWTSREIRLASRPEGEPQPSDFQLAEVEVADPGDGEIVVRNTFMSVDPYMRGRMNDVPSPTCRRGSSAQALRRRRRRRGRRLAPPSASPRATSSLHQLGWREYATVAPSGARKVDADAALAESAYLGVLGMPGPDRLRRPARHRRRSSDGDIVFVSGAAGAVGSLAGQIAKLRGPHA